METITKEKCTPPLIRATFVGPPTVGKSSVMNMFTQQQLLRHQPSTPMISDSYKIVQQEKYNVENRTPDNSRQIWRKRILSAVNLSIGNILTFDDISRSTSNSKLQNLLQHYVSSVNDTQDYKKFIKI